jgi:hypothetical protein
VNVPGVVGRIIGGWQISSIHNIRSGGPIAIGTGGINNPFGAARADYVAGQNLISNQNAQLNFRGLAQATPYLNPAAFANPPVHPGGRNIMTRLGTLGQYMPTLRDRHFVNEDISLSKVFQVDEHRSFELRGTFLNPFNRHGIGGLVTNITNPLFGQFTNQQRGARNIELAARITF